MYTHLAGFNNAHISQGLTCKHILQHLTCAHTRTHHITWPLHTYNKIYLVQISHKVWHLSIPDRVETFADISQQNPLYRLSEWQRCLNYTHFISVVIQHIYHVFCNDDLMFFLFSAVVKYFLNSVLSLLFKSCDWTYCRSWLWVLQTWASQLCVEFWWITRFDSAVPRCWQTLMLARYVCTLRCVVKSRNSGCHFCLSAVRDRNRVLWRWHFIDWLLVSLHNLHEQSAVK